jgi:hypothetical protein
LSIEDAVKVARRCDTPENRIKAFALIAEWADNPAPAIDAALITIQESRGKPTFKAPRWTVYRLAQSAAKAGKYEEAKKLADELPTGGFREWTRAEILRERFGNGSKEPADAGLMEMPDDPRNLRIGHAWGRLHIARQAARLSGDRNGAKQFESWPKGTIHPFALAGYSLGLQDNGLEP